MSETKWEGVDRRIHPRFGLTYPVQLEVARPGDSPLKIAGTTIDISRGGMMARVDKVLRPGALCRIRFLGATGRLRPETTRGTVLHSGFDPQGQPTAAFQFEVPLEELKEPGQI